jgi:Ser/Thr protein kinase RdoA (MazF antagonist)
VAYADLSRLAQIGRLRPLALAALAEYPIEASRVSLLLHGYNTTYRVDTVDGRRFALRLNVLPRKTEANLDAEMAWLAALATDTDVAVPVPLATREGALHTSVRSELLGHAVPVVMMSWLPGPDLDELSVRAGRALGRLAAALHAHAEAWSLPAGTALPAIDTVLMNVPYQLDVDHPLLTPDRRAVFDAAFTHVQAHYDSLLARSPRIALHADLHAGNLKWWRRRLAVFDFDDAGIGVPAQDLAIAAYYLRPAQDLEQAMLAGYAELRSLPDVTPAEFEAVVASRNLVLLNDVIATEHAEFRAILPNYVANTAVKLRAYLETGVYRHDVGGLLSLSG